MTALLQFEVNKKRLARFQNITDAHSTGGRTAEETIYHVARTALRDTFNNGGTFVMVVSASKITIVQRAEAEDLDGKP